MQKKQSVNVLEKKLLAIALIYVVKLWGDKHYECFLQQPKPGELMDEWFEKFLAEWGVARTIKRDERENIREYLDHDFREMLSEGNEGKAVDDAAKYIQQQGWGSRIRNNGKGSLPISIVSKVGFFFCPYKLVPLDKFAKQGLNKLRKHEDERKIKGDSYNEYLKAFNKQYIKNKPQLAAALGKQWVKDLAKELGCPASALKNIAMRRKLFDNYLMELAKNSRHIKKETSG